VLLCFYFYFIYFVFVFFLFLSDIPNMEFRPHSRLIETSELSVDMSNSRLVT
jgi:hypothetical protein